ncbi:MAG: hypothetical protein K2Y01_01960 [Rhabdochlamydiaceae bacterium]|nr:hypothetical protein [Rhabdochlamydiaceae bacterium]
MDWTVVIVILVLALCMVGCCGGSFMKGFRKNKGKGKDDDKHTGCH